MPLDACTLPAVPAHLTSLADTAHKSLIELFQAVGHRPSGPQWEAILDLLDTLESAANRGLQPAAYVSAIPAGTGKSASLAAFARALMTSPHYAGTGMVIACNRVTEVRDMAAALATHRDKLHIIVGRANTDVLAMGAHTEANQAQCVITTQAALKGTMRTTRFFDRATRYHYRGERRAVVCWDEALTFNRPVVLDADTVGSLAKEMRRQSSEAATALKEWATALDRVLPGACAVPDFEAMGVDFHRLEDDTADRDDLAAQAKMLGIIAGATGYVWKGNAGVSLISYVPELPIGLLPVIVTDASAAVGVHHASYEQMARTRRIVRLKEAAKTYRNMTLRIVPTAASRSTYRDKASTKGKELIEMAVRYIESVAPERVLVVGYKIWLTMKGVNERTIRAAIDARLTPEAKARTHHLSYGSHTATNDYKDVRRVILMGLNFLPPAASYAASGAALDKPMRSNDPADHPTTDQVEAMRLGALRDATLQAILRGNARMGCDGDCGACEVIIPQTKQTGLSKADYEGMFPGAVIVEDRTLLPGKPLTGNLLKLSTAIIQRLEAGDREMTDTSLYGALGITRHSYGKLKAKPEWAAWLAGIGLHQAKLGGGLIGLRRAG